MTAEFLANKEIRDLYGLSEGDTFNESFSVVSLESILFGIVATVAWTLEVLFDRHKEEVRQVANSSVVASAAWYHYLALRFQKGDDLIYDDTTKSYGYATEDASKRVIKYAAVRDEGKYIRMIVSGGTDGRPSRLDDEDLAPFKEYMNRVKIAGVILEIDSYSPDEIRVMAECKVDPLVIDTKGRRILDGSYPVVDAINNYLKNIDYGGTFNKNKLIDAIQNVPGVVDIRLLSTMYSINSGEFKLIDGNNYVARAGCVVSNNLENSIYYVV